MSAEGHRSHGEIPVYKEKVKHFTYTSVQMHAHMHMHHYGEEILVLSRKDQQPNTLLPVSESMYGRLFQSHSHRINNLGWVNAGSKLCHCLLVSPKSHLVTENRLN